MIRTRDLVLFLLCAGFLLVAIGVTAVEQWSTGPEEDMMHVIDVPVSDVTVAESEPELDRAARRLDLQQKLAARGDVVSARPPVVETEESMVAEEPTLPTAEDGDADSTIMLCGGVRSVAVNWPAREMELVEREGRRLFVTNEERTVEVVQGTSTVAMQQSEETIWLHLPMRVSPYPTSSCLPYDVVGVALDGSAIRNNEYGVYGIFGSETLIGYALDGFPIYGNNDGATTDACGGMMAGGQYRYYLSSEREGVLGCFAAAPVSL